MKAIIFTITICSLLFFASCSEEKRLIRKASNAVDVYDYDKAISYYDKALAKDSTSFYANAGKGIVLSEYIGRYDQAIPYLERAIRKSPDKNSMKINNDLGISYHYIGNYPMALHYYGKASLDNDVENPDYDFYLSKRIADCKFAMQHPEVASPQLQWVKNAGNTINTDMPEYGPVYTNQTLIFTSKRQDTPKEKKNGLDRRYFESMYISSYDNGRFSAPRRFTLPDYGANSKFSKGGESVVSASADGKTVYIFKESKLYEASLVDSTKGEKIMDNTINFSYLQSHAFVSPDGKMLFFTSESKKGRGGTDIYSSVKNADGSWSDPQALYMINTEYNEESPFVTENGTLYFASNGHPGYGGYDIYKTRLVNGQWTTPENLGQPINTPGDDIYFALNPKSADGFYSSTRMGGQGDMDIYHVHYVSTDVPECKAPDSLFVINAVPAENSQMNYVLSANIPEGYRSNVKSINWAVNGQPLAETTDRLDYAFQRNDTYTVTVKAVVYCDTCPALLALCAEKQIEIGQDVFVVNSDSTGGTKILAYGELGNNQLLVLGWNTTPGYFDYDEYVIRSDAKALLDQNIEVLKKNKDLTVVINGYADSRGTQPYNKNLSSQRANAVRQYLVNKGISRRRITSVVAYGETMISNGCTDDVTCDEEQHQMNRKVEFKVFNNSKPLTDLSFELTRPEANKFD